MQVSRQRVPPTDRNFRDCLEREAQTEYAKTWTNETQRSIETGKVGMLSHYVDYLATTSLPPHVAFQDTRRFVNRILQDYDFIGVLERQDESLVALALLLNVPLADVLYLSAKGHGNFDGGGFRKECIYIVPSFVSPRMQQHLASPQFLQHIQWDQALHRAANASLDT